MEEKEIQDQTVAQAPATEAPAGPDLNMNDLVAIRSIIDVASQRGSFKAAELEAVGKIYNKLNTFIESVAKRD
jgi:hypothetical protein